jgi:transcriptional regulator with XRE-family HTH domain
MMTEYNPQSVLIVFGQNIKKVREANGYTIYEVAHLSQYDRICLSQLEYGEQNIKIQTAIKLAKVLDVAFPALFSRNFMDGDFAHPELQIGTSFVKDDYLKVFAENFRKRLKANGDTEITVVETTGVPNTTVSRIVRGKYTNPTLVTLNAMAYTSKTDLYSLFLRT